MVGKKKLFCCTECGYECHNWAGKCPSCGEWNTIVEYNGERSKTRSRNPRYSSSVPKKLNEMDTDTEIRFSTCIDEFDRVLGGGAVSGSLILVGGAPGIGKSTLLLQMCKSVPDGKTVLYISGEESERQLKMRAMRMDVSGENIYVLTETDLVFIEETIEKLSPDIVIIDSIQTISNSELNSAPGSITQVRECTMSLMQLTKVSACTCFIVGHINKEGSIAGPKVLEHMVDCVLYFEGERNTSFRILRVVKNRFGSTNEIGIFEMTDSGLACVKNPSEVLLAGRPENSPGTCVSCVIEGTRPLLAEIQALITTSSYNASRRTNGIDYNRAAMLIAVIEKRGGLNISCCDAYINVVGGLTLDEPAADLATVLAIASSFLDKPLGMELAAVGEVGLSGEVRSVSQINKRLSEISRLGFKKCVIPSNTKEDIILKTNLEIIPVKNIYDAIHILL